MSSILNSLFLVWYGEELKWLTPKHKKSKQLDATDIGILVLPATLNTEAMRSI
jgi:hypothetical protein